MPIIYFINHEFLLHPILSLITESPSEQTQSKRNQLKINLQVKHLPLSSIHPSASNGPFPQNIELITFFLPS